MAIKKVCLLVSLIRTIKHENIPYEGIYKEYCLGAECAWWKEVTQGIGNSGSCELTGNYISGDQ